MMNIYLISALSFIASLVLNTVITPLVIRISHRNQWYDHHNDRKIHTGSIPRLGGIGLFISFIITFTLVNIFVNSESSLTLFQRLIFLVPFFVLHLVGLFDDFIPIRPFFKFIFQGITAVLLLIFGGTFEILYLPIVHFYWNLGIFAYFITAIWYIGISNAINFIDGMNGLSGVISFMAALGFGIISLLSGKDFTAITSFILCGSILGFLFFNFPNAKVFMGDGGSTFLGIVLAALPLLEYDGNPYLLILSGSFLIIPVFDTFAAILRRVSRGFSPFHPDKEHLHHILLEHNLSVVTIIFLIFITAAILISQMVLFWLTDNLIFLYIELGLWLMIASIQLILYRSHKRHKKTAE